VVDGFANENEGCVVAGVEDPTAAPPKSDGVCTPPAFSKPNVLLGVPKMPKLLMALASSFFSSAFFPKLPKRLLEPPWPTEPNPPLATPPPKRDFWGPPNELLGAVVDPGLASLVFPVELFPKRENEPAAVLDAEFGGFDIFFRSNCKWSFAYQSQTARAALLYSEGYESGVCGSEVIDVDDII